MKPWMGVLGVVSLLGLGGCAPKVQGATAILPAQEADAPAVWIYLQTDDPGANGVYRCYDVDQKPTCKRAKLMNP